MIAAQTVTLGGTALLPFKFDGIPEYAAPTVDLRRRDPDQDDGLAVLIFFVVALAVAYLAYCTSQGGDASMTVHAKFGIPYKWTVKCDMP